MSHSSEKKSPGKQESSTRYWFIFSIAITVLLVGFLLWHLVYSYNLMVSFRDREFVIERSSWQLLLYAETMQMSALVGSHQRGSEMGKNLSGDPAQAAGSAASKRLTTAWDTWQGTGCSMRWPNY